MAAIDIGVAATDRSSYLSTGNTWINTDNPANDTGTLTSFEVYLVTSYPNTGGARIGTFYIYGTTMRCRDYQAFDASSDPPTIAAGSKQTLTGIVCDVTTNDMIGIIMYTDGRIERATSGFTSVYLGTGSGDITTSPQMYTSYSGDCVSLYGTGETVEAGGHPTMKRWGGVPFMSLNKGVF